MTTQKQTRLDQFEINEAFGLFPDFQLTRRARLISAALNRYDVRRAGGSYYNHYFKRELGERIEDRDGVPHLFRESYERRGGKWEYCLIDCGKVRDEEKRAREFCAAFSEWFAAQGRPDVRAVLAGDLRYISITDGARGYSFID